MSLTPARRGRKMYFTPNKKRKEDVFQSYKRKEDVFYSYKKRKKAAFQ